RLYRRPRGLTSAATSSAWRSALRRGPLSRHAACARLTRRQAPSFLGPLRDRDVDGYHATAANETQRHRLADAVAAQVREDTPQATRRCAIDGENDVAGNEAGL